LSENAAAAANKDELDVYYLGIKVKKFNIETSSV